MNESDKILIEQYKRCYEDWRHYDRLLWEMPFSTLTVTGGLLTLAFAWVHEILFRTIIIFCLLILVITMTFASVKIRFFQEARCKFAKDIERKLNVIVMPVETDESRDYLEEGGILETPIVRRMISVRAFHLQLFFYFLLASLLCALFIWYALQLVLVALN